MMNQIEVVQHAPKPGEPDHPVLAPGDFHVKGVVEASSAHALCSEKADLSATVISLTRTISGGIAYEFAIKADETRALAEAADVAAKAEAASEADAAKAKADAELAAANAAKVKQDADDAQSTRIAVAVADALAARDAKAAQVETH